jgi:hypothetical protein
MSLKAKRAASVSRSICYEITGKITLSMELALQQAIDAKTVFDGDNDGQYMWLNGKPGPELRELRDNIKALMLIPEVPLGPRRRQLVLQIERLKGRRYKARKKR